MGDFVERVEDRLADFTRDKRVVVLFWMALIVGVLSASVAYVLVWLIASITNLAFYQRFSAAFQSPNHHHLGYHVILVPAIGGLIIGFMARYGSEKIRGHGIPEALEAGKGGNNGTTVLDAGTHDLIVSFPDGVLLEAAVKMLRNNIGRLPVVKLGDLRSVVGHLGRRNLRAAYLRQLEDEHIRDRTFPRQSLIGIRHTVT